MEEGFHTPSAAEMPTIPPFLHSLSGELPPPIPPAPPSPPVPPKRKVLVPAQSLQKSFPDTLYSFLTPLKGKTVPPPEMQTLRYTDLKKKPEFYLKLAAATLKCLLVGVAQNEHAGIQKLFQDKLTPELISQLAWLIINVGLANDKIGVPSLTAPGNQRERKESKKVKTNLLNLREDLASVYSDLMELVHEMILNEASYHMLHGVLLHELGLSAKCWPLQVPLSSLSVLGRVMVCRLQRQSQEGLTDQLPVSIWKG